MSILLGFDIGSSSIKASLLDTATGKVVASGSSPDTELPIEALRAGWAEQSPDLWWEHLVIAAGILRKSAQKEMAAVSAIGISYQMHGLVLIDKFGKPLRNSIIWCDSRAVPYGERAFKGIGAEDCMSHLLNSPGNFTAAKLAWVKENEPQTYSKIHKVMLPGDYIAYRLTGEAATTPSGLSEGILWDFLDGAPAQKVLNFFRFSQDLLPKVVPTFSNQGRVTAEAAELLGIPVGAMVSYRAGDQPNNALSLNVLEPGEFATTAGTSGVVYGVGDTPSFDKASRVNTFVHVNHSPTRPRYGTLLCVNGTGILNSWVRRLVGNGRSYSSMNEEASKIAPGSEGISILPFGNGAERSLGNLNLGAAIEGINFNLHRDAHLFRAAQEGIVFPLKYGLEIMEGMGLKVSTVRAGNANLFLSPLFREIFAATTTALVELFDTNGAEGAARGAGIGSGVYSSPKEAFASLKLMERIEPKRELVESYGNLYQVWKESLVRKIAK